MQKTGLDGYVSEKDGLATDINKVDSDSKWKKISEDLSSDKGDTLKINTPRAKSTSGNERV